MLIRYADLTSLKLATDDGATHAVSDVYVSEADLDARYIVVDIGGWFSDREAVVSVERCGEPDISGSRLPSDIREDELQEQPQLGAGPASPPEDRYGTRTLPVAMLGPAGGSLAPWMLTGRGAGEDAGMAASAREGASRNELHSAGELFKDNIPVEAEDGRAGELMGLIFESQGWRAAYLEIETGTETRPETQRVVPVSATDRIDWAGRAIRLKASVAHVHDSPNLHEMDGLEGKWYNKVLAYYGFQS